MLSWRGKWAWNWWKVGRSVWYTRTKSLFEKRRLALRRYDALFTSACDDDFLGPLRGQPVLLLIGVPGLFYAAYRTGNLSLLDQCPWVTGVQDDKSYLSLRART